MYSYRIVAPSLPRIATGTVRWLVHRNGRIDAKIDVRRREDAPPLPRFGLRLVLPEEVNGVRYFGCGPLETYKDKHRACVKHLYDDTVANMHEDYIRPQENGSHYNCSYLDVNSVSGGMEVFGESFCFNASRYTQEELESKAHNYELQMCQSTVLCVDAFQNGIGSNSCGPKLAQRFESPKEIRFACTLRPYRVKED